MANSISRELEGLARRVNVAKLTSEQRRFIVLRLGWDRPQGGHRSQQEVANLLGLSQPYISFLERHVKEALTERQQVAS